jgi:AcrR family transcriptional regulator
MGVAARRPIDTGYERLKPGPGKSPEHVRESQRARIHRAMIDLVAERGVGGVTIRRLTRTSGVSTRTFYAHFPDIEECFAATYRAVMRWIAKQLAEATERNEALEPGIRAWIQSLMESAADSPEAVRLAFVDAYDGGPAMLREISRETAALERLLADDPNPIGMPLARAIVAGVERVVTTRLLEGQKSEFPGLVKELGDWVLRIHASKPTRLPTDRAKTGAPRATSAARDDPALSAFRAIGGDRGLILAAVARLGATNGYWNLTASGIRREAGVSRHRLDELFKDVAECYLDAIEVMTKAATTRADRGAPSCGDWSARVEAISRRLEAEVAASPLLSRLAFTELFAPGGVGRNRSANLIRAGAQWLRTQAPGPRRPSAVAAEASVAASWRALQAALIETGSGRRSQASETLVFLILKASPPQSGSNGAR